MTTFTKNRAQQEIRNGVTEISESDIETVLEKQDEIEQKFKGPLARFVSDAKLFFSLIRDYMSGTYRDVPWWTVAAIATSLLYVLNPVDFIPDFIPGVGIVDDAFVVAACLKMITQDLDKYIAWKRKKGRTEDVDGERGENHSPQRAHGKRKGS